MKILTKNKQKHILDLIAANQIILNAYDKMEGFNKIEAFGVFCDNSAEAIYSIGGIKALNESKEFIFLNDSNKRANT